VRTETLLLAFAGLSAGCAAVPPLGATAADMPCVAQKGEPSRPDPCRFPEDVRAFVAARDLCDHFRGEPWPEGNDAYDNERRAELADGIRGSCAGTDRKLAELLRRYRDDRPVMELLSEFEPDTGF